MGYACQATIVLVNSLAEPLNLHQVDLPHGVWQNQPPGQVATGGVVTISATSAECAMIGPEGTFGFQLPDATQFTIYFIVPYGSDPNQLTCNVTGPGSMQYRATVNSFGGGRSPTGTIVLQTAPVLAATSKAGISK